MSSDQFGRKASLVVANEQGGLDLSQLRFRFDVVQSDIETPNHVIARVYNLAEKTASQVSKEFSRVILQAGYENGAYGVIFDGTIKQVRVGRENQTDTYLDISAADGDVPYNQGIVSLSLAAGSTPEQQIRATASQMGLPVGYLPDLPVGAASRGKVKFGMGRNYLRDVTSTVGCSWSIQNGELVVIPLTGYRPGEAVVLNSATGLVGIPEVTEGGIRVRCLLNPKIRIGCLVQINNADINKAFLGGGALRIPGRLENFPGALPRTTEDGFYRVYVSEFHGDTRGNDWYSELTCLAVDRSAPATQAVSPS